VNQERNKIGEIFVKAGVISETELDRVIQENRAHPGEKLGQTLVRLNLATESEVARALSYQLELPYIDLNTVVIDPRAIRKIPLNLARQYQCLPIYLEKNDLILAMADPQNFEALETLRFSSGCNIRPHLAEADEILAAIGRYYELEDVVGDIIQNVPEKEDAELLQEYIKLSEQQLEELKTRSEAPAIVKLVNTIIFQGIAVRASVIQIEPQDREVVIKNRIDGVFVESMRTPKWTKGALISRIKLMAGMSLAERHTRQKGQCTFKLQTRVIELNVVSRPTEYGECLILHILSTGERIPPLAELALRPDDVRKIQEILQLPQGFILVCGPTGSGKTTMLYTLAHELFQQNRRIVTLETVTSYGLPGVTQVQINAPAGLTFTKALQSVLRHRPEVILLGEIPDLATAEMAMRAAIKGHLVISTLDANGVLATILRLKALGVRPQLLAAALAGIITQRLVRKICDHCKEPDTPDATLFAAIAARLGEHAAGTFTRGKGCAACNYTGYQGRIGVYHAIAISNRFREFIAQGAPEGRMRQAVEETETATLLKAIWEKVTQGLTRVAEVERVLFAPETTGTPAVEPCPHCQQPMPANSQVCPACGQSVTASVAAGVEQITQPAQIPISQAAQEKKYQFEGFKILVVDDDPDLRRQLHWLLQDKQFAVTTASDGLDAWEQMVREKPHLVITDITMPRMDGFELVRRLRKEITTAFIPVIMLSNRTATADRLKGFAVGTDDYLPKPFSMQELFFRINAILKRVYR